MILTSPVDLSPLLATPETISPRDVLEFRGEVFRDGLVSKQEADALFMINEETFDPCQEWYDFFIESISDFVTAKLEPRGDVSVENSEWLIRQISRDGRVKTASELELLVKTLEKADLCPPSLVNFVLQQIAQIVILGDGELIGNKELTAGVIGKSEVELLRRVIYSVSGSQSIGVSRDEAQILFDLNDKTTERENHPSWNELFVKAIASHLMAVSGYTPPDRHSVIAHEEGLEDTDLGVAGTLKKVLSSFSDMFSEQWSKGAFRSDHKQIEGSWNARNNGFDEAVSAAEKIEVNEGSWLVERIGRDDNFHENEKALIRFLKENSPSIHPSLQPLLDKVA